MQFIKRINWLWSHTAILTILLVCSVILNVLLAQRIRALKTAAAKLEYAIEYDKGLSPGDVAPPLALLNKEGTLETIAYAGSRLPTVLYIFTPDCDWCKRNNENIKFLASQVSDKYRFIGISLKGDKLDEYLVRYQIQFPVYHSPTKDVFLSYKLGSTPQTIVVSNDGKILANWKGAYSKQERVNIEGFFDVHLPGVAEQSKVSQ